MAESSAPVDLEIGASFNGWPITVRCAVRLEQLGAVVKRLEAAGLTPAAQGGTHAPRPKAPRVEPFYDGDGTACCPKHQKPLKQGQYGPYCSAKDPEGKNGYCGLRFSE